MNQYIQNNNNRKNTSIRLSTLRQLPDKTTSLTYNLTLKGDIHWSGRPPDTVILHMSQSPIAICQTPKHQTESKMFSFVKYLKDHKIYHTLYTNIIEELHEKF